jgi:hypothetical protein
MSPPIMFTKRLLMVRPSPVPPYLRVVELSAWLKASNSLAICSCVRPIPVSLTENISFTWPSSCLSTSVEITISPESVNLTALLAKLIRTCPNRKGSPTRNRGTSGADAKRTSTSSFS